MNLGLDGLFIDERTQVLFIRYEALLNEMFAEVNITAARPGCVTRPRKGQGHGVWAMRGEGGKEGRKSLSAEKLKVRQHQTV